MAGRMTGAKSLPESVLAYCQLDQWEQTSANLHQNSKIFCKEDAFKMSSKWQPFCLGFNML